MEDDDYNEMVAIQEQRDLIEQTEMMTALGEKMFLPYLKAIEESVCQFDNLDEVVKSREKRLKQKQQQQQKQQTKKQKWNLEAPAFHPPLSPSVEVPPVTEPAKEDSWDLYEQPHKGIDVDNKTDVLEQDISKMIKSMTPVTPTTLQTRQHSHKETPSSDSIAYYYQEAKGRRYIMYPFIMRALLEEHQDYESLPSTIHSKVRDMETVFITTENRRRYLPLRQFPVNSEVTYIEIELNKLVSHRVFEAFLPEMKRREAQRKKNMRYQRYLEKKKQVWKIVVFDDNVDVGGRIVYYEPDAFGDDRVEQSGGVP